MTNGGWEVLAGAEVDVTKRWTVSAGWQTTNYGLGKNSQFISDMSFVTNSNSVGVGARFQYCLLQDYLQALQAST